MGERKNMKSTQELYDEFLATIRNPSLETHNGMILSLIRERVTELKPLTSNYNAYGIEGTFVYTPDGKTYQITIQEVRPKKAG